MAKETFTIDAKGKTLGRVASLAASRLMGKHTTDYARNIIPDIQVEISNAAGIRMNEAKAAAKDYIRYSGYPGGKKTETLDHLAARRGYAEVVRRAVYGMLPNNKLRAKMLKRLSISE